MKKLFSLLFVALLTMSAWGTTVTFVPGNPMGTGSAANDANVSMTLDGVTISSTLGALGRTDNFRFGKDAVVTVTSTVGNITKVEFTSTASYGSQYGPQSFSGEGYSAQSGSKVGTWTGNAESFSLEASAQVRCSEIVVTIADATSDELVPPVFNPNGGEFTSSLEVSLTCATPNAEIQYYECDPETHEIDWTTYHYYTQPFYVNETKTFAAYASKGNEVSEYAYATFTKVLPTCAAPTFTPASGATFEDDITVRIDCETEGATILYTVNEEINEGTAPVYITLNETATITAVASLEGYQDSQEVTATYTKTAPYNVGGTATFVAGVDEDPDVEYRKEADLTIAKDNVTMQYHGTQYDYYTVVAEGDTTWTYTYRIYKGKDIKFTSTAGNIRKIVFDCESSNPVTGFNAVEGLNMETATWEGNAREVTFTAGSKQVRCYTITVTLDDDVPSIVVAEPVFDPENNTKFVNTLDVTITSETEGAAIYYSINDGDYQLYENPIPLNETSTIKAYAELEGVQSTEATAKYTKLTEVSTIAEANALGEKTDFIFYGNVVVVYQNGSNLWVKDETGYGLIFGNQVPTGIQDGATLKEEWTAQYTLYRDAINEYMYPTNVAVDEDEPLVTIEPIVYTSDQITTDVINQRVLLKGLTLLDGEGKYMYNEADSLVIYNNFSGVQKPEDLTKKYDVEGMVSYYGGKVQIMPISFTEVAEPAGLRGDVNNDNEVNISDAIALINAILNSDTTGINTDNANVNGDDEVNISDAIMLINYVLNSVW
ncbi:MAG: chitobiase/beta-hexosaminidase C-terminal domain-containing protein [Muribaculaceae bacterium]|nr:chitobiase/beta-hexosaminidase C-terminal domain-containing protein [Muribaculaceae bacterium]